MDVRELISKLEEVSWPGAQVQIMVKPLTGQMALVVVREPWDDNIVVMETGDSA